MKFLRTLLLAAVATWAVVSTPAMAATLSIEDVWRAPQVEVLPDRLRAYDIPPDEVVAAITKGNLISPSGNVRIGDLMPMVPINSVAAGVNPS